MFPPVVVGAGICGLTAAAALRIEGYQPTVVDRASGPESTSVGILVGSGGVRVLDHLGVLDNVTASGQPLSAARFLDANGRTIAVLDFERFEAARFHHTPISIDRVQLIDALRSALEPIEVEYGRTCTGTAHQARDEQVKFADGEAIQSSIVVGADGVHSEVRRSLSHDSSIQATGWYANHGFAVEPLEDHLRSEVWQVWGPGTRVRFAAVDWQRVGWTILTDGAVGSADEPEHLLARLSERCRGYPEPVRTLLARTDPGTMGVDRILRTPRLDSWCGEAIALAGDAAHAAVPMLGGHVGLSMIDGYVIADRIRGADTIADGLQAYEADRKPIADWFNTRSSQLLATSTLERTALRGLRNRLLRLTPEGLTHRYRRRLAST